MWRFVAFRGAVWQIFGQNRIGEGGRGSVTIVTGWHRLAQAGSQQRSHAPSKHSDKAHAFKGSRRPQRLYTSGLPQKDFEFQG